MTKIEQNEKYLDSIDPKSLSMTDLKSYVDVAIAIDQHKTNKDLIEQYQKKGDRVIPVPMM